MQYPSMNRSRAYRVTIPQLNGGVNYAVPPHLIEDNQLSDVRNMWYKDGRLQTRPALCQVGASSVIGDGEGATVTYLSTTKLRNKICVASKREAGDTTAFIFSFFAYTGEFVGEAEIPVHASAEDAPETVMVVESATDSISHDVIVYMPRSAATRPTVYGVGANGNYDVLSFYTPTVIVKGQPSEEKQFNVEGVQYEPYNLMNASFKCKYTTDGVGAYYSLLRQGVDSLLQEDDEITVTYISSEAESTHTLLIDEIAEDGIYREIEANAVDGYKLVFESKLGMFYFIGSDGKAAVLPLAQVGNNVTIEVRIRYCETANLICNMQLSAWFGGGSSGLTGGTRLFVSGNPSARNILHWSALNDPLYFPESNYAYVGDNTQAVTAFGKQNELLVIFKEHELYCSYYVQGASLTAENLENQQATDVEAAQAIFPIYPLSPSIGCDLPNTICLCNNRLVWLNSSKRVYGLFTTGQYNERNVRVLSGQVNAKLDEIDNVTSAVATEHENNYLLHIGGDVFVLDYSSAGFVYYSSYSSDEKSQKAAVWYRWQIADGVGFPPICAIVTGENRTVYIAKSGARYVSLAYNARGLHDEVNGETFKVASSFSTKLFDFGYPERLKRVNPFYLQASGGNGETIKLTYFRANGRELDAYAPTLTGVGLDEADPIRITPNANRVREFGIGLECSGRMEIGSLTLNYSVMGVVR